MIINNVYINHSKIIMACIDDDDDTNVVIVINHEDTENTVLIPITNKKAGINIIQQIEQLNRGC